MIFSRGFGIGKIILVNESDPSFLTVSIISLQFFKTDALSYEVG
ncbi:MAG: hypothetical protein AAFR31_00720 [Cyanobacteria bacterium J06627_8]